jgi:hypothetical protein
MNYYNTADRTYLLICEQKKKLKQKRSIILNVSGGDLNVDYSYS